MFRIAKLWTRAGLRARVVTVAGLVAACAIIFWWQREPAADPLPIPPVVEALQDGIALRSLDGHAEGLAGQPLAWAAEGRFAVVQGGRGLRHEWPGLALRSRFAGPSLVLQFDDYVNRYRLTVDGTDVAVITRPGKASIRVDGLGPGEHVLHLAKLSESPAPADIVGLRVPDGGTPLSPPALPDRRIDVYGDSDSVGFGNLSAFRDCPGENVFLQTDTTLAWPTLLAGRYGAVARVTARTGIGLVRNAGGAFPGKAMSDLWTEVLPSAPGVADGGGSW